ncbi:MAG TPA: tol-pal system protein YbgF [Burkholderiaceae bacterium]|nr:tol-pal system protein YbgF [Burkholderiaceae bacterium]
MNFSTWLRPVSLFALTWSLTTAQAGIFDDDEARKAILDLRQQFVALVAEQNALKASQQAVNEDNTRMRAGMLELQNQIDRLKTDLALLRGDNEQLKRMVTELQLASSDIQKRQTALVQTTEQRLSKFEPVKVQLDGREFVVDPNEKRDYDAAFDVFRSGDYGKAQKAIAEFLQRYPSTLYSPSALFWLGNAQYSTRNYKEAIVSFRTVIAQAPNHLRASDAVLSIANCQIEMKDTKAARATLNELLKKYPGSEAAATGAERLLQLK